MLFVSAGTTRARFTTSTTKRGRVSGTIHVTPSSATGARLVRPRFDVQALDEHHKASVLELYKKKGFTKHTMNYSTIILIIGSLFLGRGVLIGSKQAYNIRANYKNYMSRFRNSGFP